MNRADWLRSAAAASLGGALLPTVSAPADAIASIVYDPAVYAGVLKSLANDVIKNKNDLMIINMLFQQWEQLRTYHHLNIGQIYSDVLPYIKQFQANLNKNDQISQTTKNIFAAIVQTFPDFNPNAPVPYLIDLYRAYMKASAANVIAANEASKQNIASRGTTLSSIKTRAVTASTGSDADRYQSAMEMSAYTAEGIDLLHSTVTGFVGLYSRYIYQKMAQDSTTQGQGRLLFAQQLLSTAQQQFQQNPPTYSMDQYVQNPSLLPKLPT